MFYFPFTNKNETLPLFDDNGEFVDNISFDDRRSGIEWFWEGRLIPNRDKKIHMYYLLFLPSFFSFLFVIVLQIRLYEKQ
jgi:hypothetical protein